MPKTTRPTKRADRPSAKPWPLTEAEEAKISAAYIPLPLSENARPVGAAYRSFVKARFARAAAGDAMRAAGRPWAAPDRLVVDGGREGQDEAEWKDASTPHERALWGAAARALLAYSASANWTGGSPAETMPSEIAFFVADALRDLLLTGNLPSTLERLRHQSGAMSHAMAEDKRQAVLYIRAARAGLVNDRSPRKTIAGKFQVHPRTVAGWVADRAFADADPAELDPHLSTTEGRELFGVTTEKAAQHWLTFRLVSKRRKQNTV